MRVGGKWAPIGSIVGLGTGSILLSFGALAGYGNSSGGDLVMTTQGTWPSLAMILAGSLALIAMEMAHVAHRRHRCALGANTYRGTIAIPPAKFKGVS